MPKAEGKKAGVIGWPVNHSLSPRLHGYWLKQYQIKGSYVGLAVEPQHLKETLRRLSEEGYSGVNLTVPHKEQAIEFIDEIDKNAQRIGAVNTIAVRNGKLMGSNTDSYGFLENLKSHAVSLLGKRALVIGAGGAARAVCAGLLSEDVAITLINRTQKKAEKLAEEMGGDIKIKEWNTYPQAMENIDLLVNTTSLGMKGQPPLEVGLETLPLRAVVTDIVYNPLVTPLLASVKARGNKVIDGLGMLLYQAQPAFEIFFGVKPEITSVLRDYMLQGIP